MDTHAVKIAAIVFLLIGSFYAQAQTPTAAVNHYQDGLAKLSEGDLEVTAPEKYTRDSVEGGIVEFVKDFSRYHLSA